MPRLTHTTLRLIGQIGSRKLWENSEYYIVQEPGKTPMGTVETLRTERKPDSKRPHAITDAIYHTFCHNRNLIALEVINQTAEAAQQQFWLVPASAMPSG